MQRYKYKYQVKLNDRIMFDNTSGFTKDLIMAKFVGEVISIGEETDDNIDVEFQTEDGIVVVSLPYYLAQ
jgi:hypothetical protein